MKRGDVVLVALAGDYGKPRPAVVIQSDILTAEECDSVVVCPMTSDLSSMKRFRIRVDADDKNNLLRASEIMVEKLSGVPRQRLREVIGTLSADQMMAVERSILTVLGLAAEAAA